MLLYDLTSTYLEGLAENNPLAQRGYSRDHRKDCKQVILALIVTREGFPLAHFTLVGNPRDVQTAKKVVTEVEKRFGTARRIWVMDRGMISARTLRFLSKQQRKYLMATRGANWQAFSNNSTKVAGRPWRGMTTSWSSRSSAARLLTCWHGADRGARKSGPSAADSVVPQHGLRQLQQTVATGRLKSRDKILERIGRLKGKYPKATPFVNLSVSRRTRVKLDVSWDKDKFRTALARDGVYLLRSNQTGWSTTEFWETYMQLTVVEHAFRVLKSHLLIRPVWHQYSGRVEAHIFICFLAYALWKTLDHLAKQAGLRTEISKPDPERPHASPKSRPMTPEVILWQLAKIQIGDIVIETTDGQQLALRRVARPDAEQKKILTALKLKIPERLSADRLL